MSIEELDKIVPNYLPTYLPTYQVLIKPKIRWRWVDSGVRFAFFEWFSFKLFSWLSFDDDLQFWPNYDRHVLPISKMSLIEIW